MSISLKVVAPEFDIARLLQLDPAANFFPLILNTKTSKNLLKIQTIRITLLLLVKSEKGMTVILIILEDRMLHIIPAIITSGWNRMLHIIPAVNTALLMQ